METVKSTAPCQRFFLAASPARGFGLRPKMCRPSANTEKFPPHARKTSGTQGNVTMLQGKPLEFSDFHRFAANAVSVNTFLLGEGDLLFW